MLNNYKNAAAVYAKDNNDGTAYLAFKYITDLLEMHSKGNQALDYGCGSGLSTRFLKKTGLQVQGVDIDESMLHQAIKENDGIDYKLIKSAKLPFENNIFDIVFSSFVLFEIASKNEMINVLTDIYRVLKKGGLFIAVTGSTDLYKYPWLSLDNNFPENKLLISGKVVKVRLKEINLIVNDYYWTDEDYLDVIRSTKFELLEKRFPLGDAEDGYPWVSEEFVSPYVIYILRKE